MNEKEIKVNSCKECPFHVLDGNGHDEACNVESREIYHFDFVGDIFPEWCPLKVSDIKIKK